MNRGLLILIGRKEMQETNEYPQMNEKYTRIREDIEWITIIGAI